MSMSNSNYWRKIAEDKGIECAFYELLTRKAMDDDYLDRCRHSRFYRWDANSESLPPSMVSITEDQVSNAFDLSDCCEEDDVPSFFWLDDDGKFHPVTASNSGSNINEAGLDEYYDENPNTIFSWTGNLLANNQVVGTVTYTDH